MDICDILSSVGWCFLLFVIILISYLYLTWPYSYFKNLGIPGPKPLPVIGTFTEVGKKAIYKVDEERILKYGKLVGTFEGWFPSLIVADTEMLKDIYIKDFDKFCDRRTFTMRGKLAYGVFDVKGAEAWKRQRSQLSKYFTSGKNKMSTASLNRCIDSFIGMLNKKCENGEEIEAKSMANLYTFDAICCTAFGVEFDCVNNQDHVLFTKAAMLFKNATTSNVYFLIMIFAPSFGKFLDKVFGIEAFDMTYFIQFITQIIKQREASKEETADFIDTLIKARVESTEEGKGFSQDEIIGNSLLFLFAAYETTASTLSLLMHNLTVNEECQQKVYDEVMEHCGTTIPSYDDAQKFEYMEMCIDETLRMYPPAGRLERICVEDTVVKGIPIKKDTMILLPVWYFHYNPEIWTDPEEFIPERFTSENKKDRDPLHYCPFGVGPRHCIGMRLAKLEVKLAMARIIQNFRMLKNKKTQVPLQLNPAAFQLASKDGIWLSLEKRE